MTYEQDQADLARHEREIRDHKSFNYAVLDADESHLLGCIHVDPPEHDSADAEICWSVDDDALGMPLDAALADFVPDWIAREWPFTQPHFWRSACRDLGRCVRLPTGR